MVEELKGLECETVFRVFRVFRIESRVRDGTRAKMPGRNGRSFRETEKLRRRGKTPERGLRHEGRGQAPEPPRPDECTAGSLRPLRGTSLPREVGRSCRGLQRLQGLQRCSPANICNFCQHLQHLPTTHKRRGAYGTRGTHGRGRGGGFRPRSRRGGRRHSGRWRRPQEEATRRCGNP